MLLLRIVELVLGLLFGDTYTGMAHDDESMEAARKREEREQR